MPIVDPCAGGGKRIRERALKDEVRRKEKIFDQSITANTFKVRVPRLNLPRVHQEGDGQGIQSSRTSHTAGFQALQEQITSDPHRFHNGSQITTYMAPYNHASWTSSLTKEETTPLPEPHVETPLTKAALFHQEHNRHVRYGFQGVPNPASENSLLVHRVGQDMMELPSMFRPALHSPRMKSTHLQTTVANPLLLGSLPSQQHHSRGLGAARPKACTYNPVLGETSMKQECTERCTYDPLLHAFHHQNGIAETSCCSKSHPSNLHGKEHVERFDEYLPSGRKVSRYVVRKPFRKSPSPPFGTDTKVNNHM